MDTIAEQYVKLVLAMGQHDADYVDAYYGPPEWKKEAETLRSTWMRSSRARPDGDLVNSIGAGVASGNPRRRDVAASGAVPAAATVRAVGAGADAQGRAPLVRRRIAALYDAVAPTLSRVALSGNPRSTGEAFPGNGPLVERYAVVPARIHHPARQARSGLSARDPGVPGTHASARQVARDEKFTVEYVTNKSWSGYNWYQGGFRSLIQVNTDLPIYVDRAIDLACHEGYPGHHVYNALLEKNLVKDRGWIAKAVGPHV